MGRRPVTAVLLDTHTWAWSLAGDERLSKPALAAINAADRVLVSPITFFEIAQKIRVGKWPEMEPFVDQLATLLEAQGGSVAGFNPSICIAAGMMAWTHRDSFDRLLAATAMHYILPLVSADSAFDGIITRLW
jgi:PIN domain nuclease of toxin-antitoxin system